MYYKLKERILLSLVLLHFAYFTNTILGVMI